jgi:hypothetical protein
MKMWIRKANWEGKLLQNARLEVELKSKIGENSRLEREVDYWRAKFESEQNRADRISDKSLSAGGLGPVSDLGVREAETFSTNYQKMMKDAERMNTEMFAEVIPGEETEELQIDPALLEAIGQGLRQ